MKPTLRSEVNRLLAFPDNPAVTLVTRTFRKGKTKENPIFGVGRPVRVQIAKGLVPC